MDGHKGNPSFADIANGVRKQFNNQQNKNHFREQIQRFYKKYQTWENEGKKYSREIQLHNGEDKKSYEKRIKKLKKPRRSPLDLLDLRDTYKNRHNLDLAKYVCSEGSKLSAKESEILEACYVLLAIIHDNYFEFDPLENSISGGIWPQDEVWVVTKWKEITQYAYQSTLQNKLSYMFELVETNLPVKTETQPAISGKAGDKKQAETGQNNIEVQMKLVIDELKGWEEKYLPDMVETGKLELVEIIYNTTFEKVIGRLQWLGHQQEVEEIKAECTKILQWFHSDTGILSQELDNNPFVANLEKKDISLKLTGKLEDISKNLKKDSLSEKQVETVLASDEAEDVTKENIPIEDKELTILVDLAEGTDKTCTQIEIEAATKIKRGTIKDKLLRLENIGLVHRPLGKRKGYQITNKGRQVVQRNQ